MKVSNKQFILALRANAGLYAKTAQALSQEFEIDYSRQAVRLRAMKLKDELTEIEEANLDLAEEGLHHLMKCDENNIKLRAIEFYLKTKGKKRGYVERKELTDGNGDPTPALVTVKYITMDAPPFASCEADVLM